MERRSPYHVKLSGETNRKVKRNMVKRWQNRLIKQRPGDILDSHVPPRAESIRGGPRPRGRAAPRPGPQPARRPPPQVVVPLSEKEKPETVDVSINGGWKVFVVVLTWVLVGAAVYKAINKWSFGASVYYTVQAGFSIGFGALSEDKWESQLWSIFMIATGATAAAAALGYYVESWFQHLDKLDENATNSSMTLIGVLTGAEIEDVDGDGKTDCWDVLDKLWHESCGKHLTFTRKALLAMVLWVGVGVVFGMVDQKWGFVRSLYFSVAAMSTAGLQAPAIRGDGTGLGDDFSAYFVAVFCLLGVPLFGVAMGLVANIFVDSLVQARVTLPSDLTDEEFNRVAGLSIDDGTVQRRVLHPRAPAPGQGRHGRRPRHQARLRPHRLQRGRLAERARGPALPQDLRAAAPLRAVPGHREAHAARLRHRRRHRDGHAGARPEEPDLGWLERASDADAASPSAPPMPSRRPRGAPRRPPTHHHASPRRRPAGRAPGGTRRATRAGRPTGRAEGERRRPPARIFRRDAPSLPVEAPVDYGDGRGRNAGGGLLGAGARPRARRDTHAAALVARARRVASFFCLLHAVASGAK